MNLLQLYYLQSHQLGNSVLEQNSSKRKLKALKNAIEEGNEYGYISWDGLLDLCDEDMSIGRYIIKELKKMKDNNEIQFDITEIV